MGGSNGGGGSSGKVGYPAYMETMHSSFLDDMHALINEARLQNPYWYAVAYNPDMDLAHSTNVINAFNNIVTALNPSNNWSTFWDVVQTKLEDTIFAPAAINAKVSAYRADVEARLEQRILPLYKRGIQNVRAVMTSAFTIGEALLTGNAQRDVDKFAANILRDNEIQKYQLISKSVDSIQTASFQQIEANRALANTTIEGNRIKIVAKHEENEANLTFAEKDKLWDLELYLFGGNLLASIGSGVAQTTGRKVSTTQSVLGGAMSGAAAGGMIGGSIAGVGAPLGAGIGAILGGVGGLL